jgi:hypothetical protein
MQPLMFDPYVYTLIFLILSFMDQTPRAVKPAAKPKAAGAKPKPGAKRRVRKIDGRNAGEDEDQEEEEEPEPKAKAKAKAKTTRKRRKQA